MFKSKVAPLQKPDFLTGGGEMEKLIRAFDWSKTSAGPLESWSTSIKYSVQTCLTSCFPSLVCCGPDLLTIYNDAYIPIANDKHPDKILGLPGKIAYGEIWPVVGSKLHQVMDTGIAYKDENCMVILNKNGFLEENYQTFSLSPIGLAEGDIQGILITIADTTSSVIRERHLRTLNNLGAHSSKAKTAAEACRLMARDLDENDADIPFALLYLLDAECRQASLQDATRLAPGTTLSPKTLSLNGEAKSIWPLARVIQSRTLEVMDVTKLPPLPSGRWEVPPTQAVLLPLMAAESMAPMGILIVGVNPRRRPDETYRNFYTLVASLTSTAITNAQAHEKERQRIESLAEIDRAKTAFFSNVSHEFRTPITLLLGPLEELLSDNQRKLHAEQKLRLQMMQRNALRLSKLTNTLLDFSRIEAGRLRGQYRATDLAKLTMNLSSMFRAAIEKAGLQFKVDVTPLEEPVYVDPDMWEKILFNLLSNAFKYTLQGGVTATLKKVGSQVELCVSDTGAGIPEAELPRVFERFHRIKGVIGRSHEGTGIGLALTHELVKLHGGTIQVTSQVGKGSTFIVRLPLGKAHLPAEQISSPFLVPLARPAGSAFVEEALEWLPGEKESMKAPAMPMPISILPLPSHVPASPAVKAKILLADDNADMRDYVRSILTPHYEVITAADGEAALHLVLEQKPDLILSDVMMPKLDGLQLTRTLRQEPTAKWLPIILLSARAGEEARVEGLACGADDYIVKPFSAKELLARIKTHLTLGKVRAELRQTINELQEANTALAKSEHNYRTLTTISPVGIYHTDREGRVSYVNERCCKIMGGPAEALLGDRWAEAIHPADKERVLKLWGETVQGKVERFKADYRYLHPDGTIIWVTSEAVPQKDSSGQCLGYIGTITDITEIKALEAARLKEAASYRAQLEQFTDTLCHELRNPLNGIYGSLSLLQTVLTTLEKNLLANEELSPSLKTQWLNAVSEMQGYTSDMESCAKHQKTMLDDVLSLSKLEASKVELNLQNFEPKAVVLEVVTMVKTTLHQKHLTLHLKLDEQGEKVKVKMDAARLKQILLNLLSNAVKFTPEGGSITLGMRVLPERTANYTSLEFTVEDTGIGMTAAEKARLFNRFAQASRETFQRYGGSGLGLVISKHLVELMHGKIEVDSEKGRGTKFTVIVSCQNAVPEQKPTSKAKLPSVAKSASAGRKGLRVLIVEDNVINQKVLKRLLEQAGHHCEVVGNGQQAVAFVEKNPVDIVLMDIQMPVMDGLEATKTIRQLEKNADWQRPAVPIIGLSANSLREYGGGIPPGMNDYLSKPYEKEKLLEKLRQHTQTIAKPLEAPQIEAFIVEGRQSEQRGWNCFDVAIGLSRDGLCQFALDHKGDIHYRRLLAPEIRTAAAITTVLMNQQAVQALEARKRTIALAELFHLLEIAQQWGEQQDQEEVISLIERALQAPSEPESPSLYSLKQLALPSSMHTQELRQLVNAYTEAHEAIKPEAKTCNQLLGRTQGQFFSVPELVDFFNVAENRSQHQAAYQAFVAIQSKFLPHEEALQAYCESEQVYESYIRDYYGQHQWFAFQPAYAGGRNTSMVDIAAKCLGRQLIIYQLKEGQREEIYRTQGDEGLPILHVQYNGAGHFVALKPNPKYVEGVQATLLTTVGLFGAPGQTGSPEEGVPPEEVPPRIAKTIMEYLQ